MTDASTAATPAPSHAPAQTVECDGIVCFGGEDYWYHNRGHYDMQMMRELSARVPVLYINSIGMRVPTPGEGAMFARRVVRKLRSIARGYRRVRDGFAVLSPLAVPGARGEMLNPRLLPTQVRAAARATGIRRPMVWVNCPPGVQALDGLKPAALVYQRTDRYEDFKGVDREQISGHDRRLKREADLTLFCSSYLFDDEAESCRDAAFVDHGVDFDRFRDAGLAVDNGEAEAEPADVRELPRPRVGFIGGIDAHTFDPPLFNAVVERVPEAHFFLVGGCSLPEGWCPHANVTHLGKRPYDEVPGYMAAADVLIMPWNDSPWIRACNPVKLKEYLAVGRPIVTTPFEELRRYEGLTRVARDAAGFAEAIRGGLADRASGSFDPAPGRDLVERQTWTDKADAVVALLAERGIGLRAGAGR